MEHFGEAEDLDGVTIHLLGGSLQSSLHVLSKVCSVFADFRPVPPLVEGSVNSENVNAQS